MKQFTLARLKGIAAFLGATLTFATTVLPDLPGDNTYWTAAASILTFVSVYAVPNLGDDGPKPRRALIE